jgi:hypothetical protein
MGLARIFSLSEEGMMDKILKDQLSFIFEWY